MANLSNINNKFLVTTGGNVGIGTTSPSSRLSISGLQAAIDITRGNSGDSKWEFSSDSTGLYFSEMSTGTRAYMMTIKETTGNVGIGTTSPDFALDIEASGSGVQLQIGRTSSNAGSTWMGSDSNGFHLGVGAYGSGNSVADPNGFTVDTSGNVGIGTTSPGTKLEVAEATANTDVILRVKATRDAYLQFAPANTVKWGLIADYPDLGDFTTYNYSNNFNAIICKDNKNITTNLGGGNFSIATTTSSGKLTVDNASGNTLALRKGTGTPSIAFGGTNANEAVGLLEGIAGGGFSFYVGSGTLASSTWSNSFIINADKDVCFYFKSQNFSNILNSYWFCYVGNWF